MSDIVTTNIVTKILLLNGSSDLWQTDLKTHILTKGEPAVEFVSSSSELENDTLTYVKLKIGDGCTEYRNLPYVGEEYSIDASWMDRIERLISQLQDTDKSHDQKIQELTDALKNISIPVQEVSSSDSLLTLNSGVLSSTLNLVYDNTTSEIKLLGRENVVISVVSAAEFVKDGMLEDVAYDPDSNSLTFVWNTAAGLKHDSVELTDLLDPYVSADGISIDGTAISVKVSSASEEFLKVSPAGLEVSGIKKFVNDSLNALQSSVATLEEDVKELKQLDIEGQISSALDNYDTSEEVDNKIETAVEDIEKTVNNSCKIESISLNGTPLPIDSNKNINIVIKGAGANLVVSQEELEGLTNVYIDIPLASDTQAGVVKISSDFVVENEIVSKVDVKALTQSENHVLIINGGDASQYVSRQS